MVSQDAAGTVARGGLGEEALSAHRLPREPGLCLGPGSGLSLSRCGRGRSHTPSAGGPERPLAAPLCWARSTPRSEGQAPVGSRPAPRGGPPPPGGPRPPHPRRTCPHRALTHAGDAVLHAIRGPGAAVHSPAALGERAGLAVCLPPADGEGGHTGSRTSGGRGPGSAQGQGSRGDTRVWAPGGRRKEGRGPRAQGLGSLHDRQLPWAGSCPAPGLSPAP